MTVLALSSFAQAEVVSGTGIISRVVDGDTYWIKADSIHVWRKIVTAARKGTYRWKSRTFKMRLLNVDTEESVHRNKSKNTVFGKLTSRLVKKELSGRAVSFVCHGVGYYGRTLCSIYAGKRDYGRSLVKRGLSAYVTKYGKHFLNHKQYVAAEHYARLHRLGIWSKNKIQYIEQLLRSKHGH